MTAGALALGSMVQGLAGFGLTIVALPIMSLILPMRTGTPLCVLSGLVCSLPLLLRLRKDFDWRKLAPLTLGNVFGVIIGTFALVYVPEGIIRMLMGAFIVFFSLLFLTVRLPVIPVNHWWGVLVGTAGASVSAAFGGGGPIVTAWVALQGWKRDTVKTTLIAYFTISSGIVSTAHAFAGLIDAKVLLLLAASLVPIALGAAGGLTLYKCISTKQYTHFVFLFLIIMGIIMFAKGWGMAVH